VLVLTRGARIIIITPLVSTKTNHDEDFFLALDCNSIGLWFSMEMSRRLACPPKEKDEEDVSSGGSV
jgi:hypothetical protein